MLNKKITFSWKKETIIVFSIEICFHHLSKLQNETKNKQEQHEQHEY